ncbi:response regulator [Tautonia marina]|uniref:response regulator n=1 Tax=Tautonia marina TaxID=2653855 RepID=UPI001260BD4B|nr:response regulator [Tautonia marina]
MSRPRVLNVGQCGYDHSSIARFLQQSCNAQVDAADSSTEALDTLRSDPKRYDLVLVNRVFDRGGESGLDLIKTLRADPTLAEVPLMLVSNYPDAQQQALDLGALPGFGKSDLGDSTTAQRLRDALSSDGGF